MWTSIDSRQYVDPRMNTAYAVLFTPVQSGYVLHRSTEGRKCWVIEIVKEMERDVEKIDLKKTMKHLYHPSAKEVVEVDVPAANYLMIDGEGDPNTSLAYSDAIEALYAVSYAVKFMIKKGPLAIDYSVMPLEGLWWADDMSCFTTEDKSNWKWTMMICQPSFVSREIINLAISEVQKKKNPNSISKVRLECFSEGKCAQIMHVGPFTEEGPTVEKLH